MKKINFNKRISDKKVLLNESKINKIVFKSLCAQCTRSLKVLFFVTKYPNDQKLFTQYRCNTKVMLCEVIKKGEILECELQKVVGAINAATCS